MRRKIVIGNWKMNKTNSETIEFINGIKEDVNISKSDIVICPSFIALKDAIDLVKTTDIKVGAQDVYFEDNGAYTGEISVNMLKDIGVKYCIIGHSERRAYFGESDEAVNKKAKKLISMGIVPIICVGETLKQREDNDTYKIVINQVEKALYNISLNDASNVIIAYEPIWAIGTGKTATKEQAQEVCMKIREAIELIYGSKEVASKIRIIYGGSVTKETAKEIFDMNDIDGGLIGGASLKLDFINIAKSV